MPTFDVSIRGKRYHVEIPDPGGCPLRVIVDGELFDVDVSGGPAVVPASRATQPPAASEPPSLPEPRRVPLPPAAAPSVDGASEVIAPLPGTVLSVEVNVGQTIEAGQVLCVLEAMKMKNPIRGTHAGTVTEVAVQPGQTVSFGDLLVRLA